PEVQTIGKSDLIFVSLQLAHYVTWTTLR
ncbi:virulence metalloprotease, partial [Vibrio parahaemolyticus VPTS-2010_2]